MDFSYDRRLLEDWLGRAVVESGQAYVPRVSQLRWDGDTLLARVQGSKPRPYEVSIDCLVDEDGPWAAGECSCAVGFDCKHVAAVLLANLKIGIPTWQLKSPLEWSQGPLIGRSEFGRSEPRRDIEPDGVSRELIDWLQIFKFSLSQNVPGKKKPAAQKLTHALAYVLSVGYRGMPSVSIYKARLNSTGAITRIDDHWDNIEAALTKPPKFVSEADLPILRGIWLARAKSFGIGYPLAGANGAATLELMINTGRTFAGGENGPDSYGARAFNYRAFFNQEPLRPAAPRQAQIIWQEMEGQRTRPVLQTTPPASALLMTDPVMYMDTVTGEAGTVQMPWPLDQVNHLLTMPPISATEAAVVASVMLEVAPSLPLPPAGNLKNLTVVDVEPVSVLKLDTVQVQPDIWSYGAPVPFHFGRLSFDYGGNIVDAASPVSLVRQPDGSVVQIKRRLASEQARLAELKQFGFKEVPSAVSLRANNFPTDALAPKSTDDWAGFVRNVASELRQEGWRIEMTDRFEFNVAEVSEIDGNLRQGADGWFDVEMGIKVNGRPIRLEPLLAALFKRDSRWLSGSLEAIEDTEVIELRTDRNERVQLLSTRLKPVVRVLIDLFDSLGTSEVRVSKWDIGRLADLGNIGRWEFPGEGSIKELAQRLLAAPGMVRAAPPLGLKAELRGYQHDGLAWMQYLREHDLSGILADEMGLGKTVQTLAHILSEKEAGRLDRPALVIVPTTLMHNWRQEAKKFTPGIRLLSLHGSQRHESFDAISKHDLVLTTYALLWRDHKMLAKHKFHLLVLDEAQNVKNTATKAATVIRELESRHRLCLTGTPLENHLGELWSQFDFLLPGFLGTLKDFTKRWRTPIEKGGDAVRSDLLAKRIRPFMLRRRKLDVAAELPPKTIVVKTVELEGAQRDLYEAVRAAMQEKVRTAIAEKGLARSHMVVLDALLKLRQICCDPRLLKLAQAQSVKESAKLELLLDMLGELVEEGHRILVFSQFTSMLELIGSALTAANLPFVLLTGETTDRETPIRRFSDGEVPIFLISLKAGGVGLNLTAADTVIHYDPWWNPAAENQASDRAHRMGQDKPVFVYKLIAAGSIEEKILEMQAKKAALADAVMSEDGEGGPKFSADDLAALLDDPPVQ